MERHRIQLVADLANPRVRGALDDLLPWLNERVQVAGVLESPDQPFDPAGADLVVILGGDGAILSTAVRLAGCAVPCIGVRLGHFGFLAELEPASCRPYLERIFHGEGTIHERFMLACDVRRAGATHRSELALNDAVVTARTPARMLALHLDIDGQAVATYRGDGLIIATPIGSTAHSLAAGGPVVEPDSSSILVTPLAPHTLTSRPLVLDDGRTLRVRVSSRYRRSAVLALDGQRTVAMRAGDEVEVRRADARVRFISIVERSFFQTLREKFRWAGSVPLDGDAGERRT